MSGLFTENNTEGQAVLKDADAMIRANGQAEAQEISDLKAAAGRYQSEIEELKALQKSNVQLLESQRQWNDQLQKSNAQTLARIQSLLEELSASTAALGTPDWSGLEKHVDDAGYDAGRKAADSVEEARGSLSSELQTLQEKIADLIQQSDDFQHKENVRVYRNVQAATDQLLQKQTDELRVEINPLKNQDTRKHGNGLSIAALIVSLLTLAAVLCDSFGLIQLLLQWIHN